MFKYVNFSIISIKVIHRHIIADICDDLINVEHTRHSQVRVCLVYDGVETAVSVLKWALFLG